MNRWTALLTLVAVLGPFLGFAEDLPAPFPVAVPSHLIFGISNVFGASLELSLKNGVVICQRTSVDGSKKERSVHPSTADWHRFIRALNKANVYAWIPDYENRNVLDGGSWRIELILGKNEFYSKGVNAYPSDVAPYLTSANGNPTHAFEAFWNATCALAGEDSSSCPLK